MKLCRRERLLLGAILLVGLALRLGLVFTQRADILFHHPVLDEQRYVDAARAWAAGRGFEARPFWQPPGILYALGATFRLFGPGLLAPRIVQALLSTACALLVFLFARRLFSTKVALAAAAILSLHGVLIFESYELLPPTYILFFDLLALLLLLVAGERRSAPGSLATGVAFGIAALFSPLILPFVAIAALWLRRTSLAALLVLGTLLPIAPVTYRNWTYQPALVPISSNGGLNFYLGNNEHSDATLALRPGRHWTELTTLPEQHGIRTAAGASSYFFHQGLAYLRAHPAQAALRDARKLYLFFNGGEIPRDTDLYAARSSSWILRALVWPGPLKFPDGLLLPFALLGAALLFSERKRLAIAYAFVATQALLVAAFFVTARYRVPALGMLALFASAGGAALVRDWRRSRPLGLARRAAPLVALAALLLVCNLPTREAQVSYAAELDFYRGLDYRGRDPERSIDLLRRAAAEDEKDARIWFELGNSLHAARDDGGAIDAWRRAAALDPWDSRARRRISMALVHQGDLDGAIAAIEANVATHLREPAHYAPDYLNLAFLHAKRGQLAAAAEDLRSAARADPVFTRAELGQMVESAANDPALADAGFWLSVGDVARDLGDRELARTAWRRAQALATDPKLLRALESRLN
ncbi:MAG TPA: glycosyltransferase family 39 protein [Polyangia bacterium]